MTIRNLAHAGRVDLGQAQDTEAGGRCLAFVIERSFLHPFKVLLYSLARTGSCLDLPVFVFTQDGAVRDDPVVQHVADRVRFISDDDIAQFSAISPEQIQRKHRLGWIAKYTFLKWLIFDDHDVGQMLFLDADIVCLNPADGIFDLAHGLDMGICPRMKPSIFEDEAGRTRSQAKIASTLSSMLDGDFPEDTDRMNSGVMVLGKRCLDPTFRRALLDLASTETAPNEQSYLTTLFSRDAGYDTAFLPSKYNFGAGRLSKVALPDQLRLLSRIVFLHYPGGKKPWTRPLTRHSDIGHVVWRRYEAEAHENSALIDRPAGFLDMLRGAAGV